MRHASGLAALLTLALLLSGCATTKAIRAGEDAEFLRDYDRAVIEYMNALRADPDNRDARQGLQRARIRGALAHYARGRQLSSAGRLEDAVAELQIAIEMNPLNVEANELLETLRNQLRNKIAVARDGKTELESLIERTRSLPPPSLDLPDVQFADSLTWNGSARDLYSTIGKMANISVVFDPLFVDRTINIDLRNQTLEEALTAVSSATRNFYRVTAQRTVTIVPDTPAKRQEYEEEMVQVFPLSNADLKEVSDLLRIVIDNRRLSFETGNNMIVIKDTPERIDAARRLIAAIDKARPEVVVEIEILEVDRARLKEYGLQVASPGETVTGLNGSVLIDRDDLSIADLDDLSAADVFLSPLPGLFYRLLKQDSNTRILANPQIRISDGKTAQARFGEEVPVPVTVFVPIATGGLPQQPTTSYNYRPIGVNIEVTPRTHHDGDVTLTMELEVSSVLGTGFQGLPTFGSRSITTVNRLRDGETNLLAGLIRDEERRQRAGVPGLVDIPGVGSLFAYNRRQSQETDVVITVTPRVVRVLDMTEVDLRAFQVGATGGPGLDIVLPIPNAVQPCDPAPPPGQQQPPFQPGPAPPQPVQPIPGPATPIFPPAPPPAQPPGK